MQMFIAKAFVELEATVKTCSKEPMLFSFRLMQFLYIGYLVTPVDMFLNSV